MSSLRNAIPRRPHKERSQEQGRARYGLLEKHKDYSKRARDFNVKKARLRVLRQKAVDRNPDEFHFAMLSTRTKNGVKIADRGNKALSQDVTKLLKTQDAGYLRTMLNKVRKEKETLEEEIVVDGKGDKLKALRDVGGSQRNKHTVYVDDENTQNEFDPEEWFETDEAGLERAYNRPRKTAMFAETDTAEELHKKKSEGALATKFALWKDKRALDKKHERMHQVQQARYEAVKSREKELVLAEQELDLQRAKMNNNIGGTNKNGIKFKVRERKK